MLGAAFALLSAVAFSLNAVLVRRGVVLASASQAAFVTVLMGVPMFLLAAIVTGQAFRAGDLPGARYAYLAAGGVINFVVGRQFNYKAINAIGAARAAPFQALTLPYSVLIAFLFLDESVTIGVGAGVALIMIGPAIMVERRARQPAAVTAPAAAGAAPTGGATPAPAATASVPNAGASPDPRATASVPNMEEQFALRQVEGYASAILASVAYGTSPILFRAALEDSTGISVFAGLVSYVAASGVLLAIAILPAQRDLVRALDPSMLRVFFGASFFVFAAQMLRFLALSLAPVAIVTGLERTNSVFTLILSWWFNRRLEFITLRVVIGIVTSVTGALILVAALAV